MAGEKKSKGHGEVSSSMGVLPLRIPEEAEMKRILFALIAISMVSAAFGLTNGVLIDFNTTGDLAALQSAAEGMNEPADGNGRAGKRPG